MLWVGLVVLSLALLLWMVLFASLYASPRRGGSRRYEVGGGAVEHGEPWAVGPEELLTRAEVGIEDTKMLGKVLEYGGVLSVEELEALTKESSSTLGERLRRLEAMGLIVRTGAGRYELTETGRRMVEMYREKLTAKRREEEILEGD